MLKQKPACREGSRKILEAGQTRRGRAGCRWDYGAWEGPGDATGGFFFAGKYVTHFHFLLYSSGCIILIAHGLNMAT